MHADRPARRDFIALAAAAGIVLIDPAARAQPQPNGPEKKPDADKGVPEEDVSPAEDLMREHGVLKRILLVYGEAIRRLAAKEDLPPEAIADSANIIRSFIEDYHERLEEVYLFPRLRQAKVEVTLVDTLVEQHAAGRKLTDQTLHLAKSQSLKNDDDRLALSRSLELFIRMYSPHEAREDTVLFPAFRKIISPNEYDSLGEDFERTEHKLFGDDGFEKMVGKVADIEKKLGIYELAQFTPKL
jgi:hemerythrin-like domain-containing protein